MGPLWCLGSAPVSAEAPTSCAPGPGSPATEPPPYAGRTGREAIIAQTARRHHETRVIPAVGTDDPAGACVRVEPDHTAFRCQPFDPIVPSAGGVGIRSFGVEEAARPAAANARQDTIQRLNTVAIRYRVTFLR